MSDIVDRIDALVDDQMAGGEPRTGYDFDDPTYPRCGHCDRHWHGLPITEKIAEMYARGCYDDEYRADSDDSRVLCRGSEFIGPMPAERIAYLDVGHSMSGLPRWDGQEIRWTVHVGESRRPSLLDAVDRALQFTSDFIAFTCGMGEAPEIRVERRETAFRFRGFGARGELFNFNFNFDTVASIVGGPPYPACNVCRLTIWPHQTKAHRVRHLDNWTMSEAIHSHCAPALPAGPTRAEHLNP